MKRWIYRIIFLVMLLIGGTFIYIGVKKDQITEVWRNAVMICLSCIGIE